LFVTVEAGVTRTTANEQSGARNVRSSTECYAEAEELERKAITAKLKWLREQCLFSATLWREHGVQAEEREKAVLLQAAAD
jgi:hypothetical protein